MKKFIHREYEAPEKSAINQYVEGCREVAMQRKCAEEEALTAVAVMNSDNEDSVPLPIDEPPPTDSEEYSTDDSEYTYSTDDDTNTTNTTSTDESSYGENGFDDDNNNELDEPITIEQLFDVIQKEQRMVEMLDTFTKYVTKGTVVYVLESSDKEKPPILV
ncbi:hypothetical protein LSM04_001234 [Trypanosoma melophagium]|uniref:uncharacterized protein n=1 Tax=Trypanosoma melophagium TaxID=715481 RepID=UPI003519F6C2|nr:hypothetical protein LSM04_001234 [Trypanosoma melophagium]